MMNKLKLMSLLLASLLLGACSSDDDPHSAAYTVTTPDEAPQWQTDWTYNQQSPNWKEPDPGAYENWTILMVQIEEALQPYVSRDDQLALFINGELRGLAKPAIALSGGQANGATFLLKAYGNETGTETVNASLQYYNHRLRHIFTLSDDINLNSDKSIGVDEDYIPPFTQGSAKYPVARTLAVESHLAQAGLTPSPGNPVAAFVGTECRGTAVLSSSGHTSLLVHCRAADEAVTLKYYDAATGQLFTITQVGEK